MKATSGDPDFQLAGMCRACTVLHYFLQTLCGPAVLHWEKKL